MHLPMPTAEPCAFRCLISSSCLSCGSACILSLNAPSAVRQPAHGGNAATSCPAQPARPAQSSSTDAMLSTTPCLLSSARCLQRCLKLNEPAGVDSWLMHVQHEHAAALSAACTVTCSRSKPGCDGQSSDVSQRAALRPQIQAGPAIGLREPSRYQGPSALQLSVHDRPYNCMLSQQRLA